MVELALGPLSAAASLAAAAERVGGVPDGRLAALVESCGGHPGLLCAVLDTALAGGQIRVGGGVAMLADGPVSPPVIAALLASDPRVTERAARLAAVVATRSEATSVRELSQETELPLRDLVDAMAEVLDAQVLRCEGGRIEFRHRLVREAANSVIVHRAPVPVAIGAPPTPQERGPAPSPDPRPTSREPRPPAAKFTDVEQAIILLVTEGLTNRQIASRIHLSPHTVNFHLRKVFRKLEVRSRAELVRAYLDFEPRA
jgi:DNA-binding NarL/FixJ family response regulator